MATFSLAMRASSRGAAGICRVEATPVPAQILLELSLPECIRDRMPVSRAFWI
jgi:hypothetical protein